MYVISSFEFTTYLELALTSLEQQGVAKEKILAVPLDKRYENRRLFDTIHRSDGVSLIDTGVALATACAVIGASIGFKLSWGPIFWGLIGAAAGFMIGFLFDLFVHSVWRKNKQKKRKKTAEVIIIVHCKEHEAEMVENILWDHFALGVGKYVRKPELHE